MVICAIIGCSNRSQRDIVRFFRLPAIVKHQGEQMLSITSKQRCAWLKAISRDGLTGDKLSNIFVCEKHFVQGNAPINCKPYPPPWGTWGQWWGFICTILHYYYLIQYYHFNTVAI